MILKNGQKISTNKKNKSNNKIANEDADEVITSGKWIMWKVKTYKGSCELGKGTSWCTAKDSKQGKEYYDKYTKQGASSTTNDGEPDNGKPIAPLFIVDNGKNKWQFHFESKQFMDEDDNQINISKWIVENDVPNEILNELNKIGNVKWKNMKTLLASKNGKIDKEYIEFAMSMLNITKYKINSDMSVNILQDVTI